MSAQKFNENNSLWLPLKTMLQTFEIKAVTVSERMAIQGARLAVDAYEKEQEALNEPAKD